MDHTHTFAHTHDVQPASEPSSVANGANVGLVFGPLATTNGATYHMYPPSSPNTGNTSAFLINKNPSIAWTANQSGTTVTGSSTAVSGATALTTHGHGLSGFTELEAAHVHGFSGTTGNNSGSTGATGTAFSILPPYTGVGFIIKL